MKKVYEVSTIYKGYRLYFFFENALIANEYKTFLERINPMIETSLQGYKVIDKLTDGFKDSVREIVSEVDSMVGSWCKTCEGSDEDLSALSSSSGDQES